MRTAGTYIAVAGAAIIVLYVIYQVVRAIITIPFLVKAGLALIILGGILLFVSFIRERISDAKKESFLKNSSGKEIES